MNKSNIFAVASFAIWLFLPVSHAHQLTEKYIPVGMYLNLKGPDIILGTITAINRGTRTITIGGKSVKITSDTSIWLDRSASRQKNLDGRFADLRKGLLAEMKIGKSSACVWLKVQAPGFD